MVVNGQLTYPDIIRLIKCVLDSKYSKKYKADLIVGLTNIKEFDDNE